MADGSSDLQVDSSDDLLIVPPPESGLAWCCLYTRPRHEKSMAALCEQRGIGHYLPLRRVVRRYRSGKKERWLPLFPGYLFCCADPW